ncbi:MAG: putative addiction module antidote protein [Deltaproteobacteria bacterium]|jgi:probable addiction module antidote protein|nr:putative addiction module antidote protein [Deltaproteobacteria bacterium]
MKKVIIREYDAARYLDSEEAMSEYLAACLEDFSLDSFLLALGDVAKARGMTQLAKDTGLSRASLYKTFSPGNKPQFETIAKITSALGVPLSIKSSHIGAYL